MSRIYKVLVLLVLIPLLGPITSGCIGGGGGMGGGGLGNGIGGGGGPGDLTGAGGITPPGGENTGGGTPPPPPGSGSAAPTQPGQEGVGRLRPYYVNVQVVMPGGTTSKALINTTDLGDAPLENAPPTDPKPYVVMKTKNPDYTMPAEAVDDQWKKEFYYYASYDKSVTPSVCITEVSLTATFQDGNNSYLSETATLTCPGEVGDPPTVTLHLSLNPTVAAPGDAGMLSQ